MEGRVTGLATPLTAKEQCLGSAEVEPLIMRDGRTVPPLILYIFEISKFHRIMGTIKKAQILPSH